MVKAVLRCMKKFYYAKLRELKGESLQLVTDIFEDEAH